MILCTITINDQFIASNEKKNKCNKHFSMEEVIKTKEKH